MAGGHGSMWGGSSRHLHACRTLRLMALNPCVDIFGAIPDQGADLDVTRAAPFASPFAQRQHADGARIRHLPLVKESLGCALIHLDARCGLFPATSASKLPDF